MWLYSVSWPVHSFLFNLCTEVPPTRGNTMTRQQMELKDWAVGCVYLLYMTGWWGMSLTISTALLGLAAGIFRCAILRF